MTCNFSTKSTLVCTLGFLSISTDKKRPYSQQKGLSRSIPAVMISRIDSRNYADLQCSHASTIVAILATVAIQYLFSREQELWSEIICWACLPLMVKAKSMHQEPTPSLPLSGAIRSARPLFLWAVAGFLGISSICRAETNCSKLMVSTRIASRD
jgi:hypothetical protein